MAAINFDQPSSGTVTSPSTALNIVNNGTGGALQCTNNSSHCILVVHKGAGAGVKADTLSGIGVVASSETGKGIYTQSQKFAGIHAVSTSGDGVVAGSDTGNGVFAETRIGAGVVAKSKSGAGLSAKSETENGVYTESTSGNGITAISKGSGIGVNTHSATGIGISSAGGRLAGYFKGDVEVTGDIRLINADCAEEFDIAIQVEPGTVMVLENNGSLAPSCTPYDKKVAGIISGGGGNKPGIVLNKQETEKDQEENNKSNKTRMAIALMGKVYCKVDATLSSIEIGDLLTTSPTAGHAMKANDPFKAFGAVIGKALQPLKEGKGLIPVLVALQ